MADSVKKVGLFVTCLVDSMRPSVAFSAVDLLQKAGCLVAVPDLQTCCGQPAFNSGDQKETKAIAKNVIRAFDAFDYVVLPSGSCGAMIKNYYPDLFADVPESHKKLLEPKTDAPKTLDQLHEELVEQEEDISWATLKEQQLSYFINSHGATAAKYHSEGSYTLSNVLFHHIYFYKYT